MTIFKNTTMADIVTVLFVILFLYTGISKLMDYSLFKEQIASSPLLLASSKYIAGWLPWIEFAVILLLIIPKWRLKGLYLSLVLMAIFTAYILGILLFNEKLPCSCGGVLQLMSWKQHLVFNTAFIILAIAGIKFEKQINRQNQKL
jgi:uncharacterized membrane protein YphA (DoxX/SURF4 family)